MRLLLTTLFLSSSLLLSAQTFTFGTKSNPEGKTIEVDSHGLIFDGHHTIPVMGEIHYARVPRAEWRREIDKMKAGGITTIATYVFWIHHEAEEGKWDWSENKDLHAFLQLCKDEGMPVVLRVGPFCHGEVYQGGFPEWVVKKSIDDPKNYKLRTTAPGFMSEVQSLYSNIYAQANDMLWKNGGPVIGMQIENECRGPWPYYMALKDLALKIGFDLPFYTRTGWPKLSGKEEFGKLLPLYGDYADGFWDRSMKDMPGEYPDAFVFKDKRISEMIANETFGPPTPKGGVLAQNPNESNPDGRPLLGAGGSYPYLTCELGGGMMPSYHRRINMTGNEAFPLAICKIGSGSNLPGYYMYHGGTNPYNPAHTMGETQATSVTNYNDMPYMTYDFQAQLGEMGQPNEDAYHQTRWLHQFLKDWGEELSVMDVDTMSANYARRGCFEFRNTYVRILNEVGYASVTPKDMKWEGLTISSTTVQPFAKADGQLYFISVKGMKPSITINGKTYNARFDKTIKVNGKILTVLSPKRAKSAFVIDGKMHYAKSGGILYKSGDKVLEEVWQAMDFPVHFRQTAATTGLREVKMGSQKVAAMPVDSDFAKAAVYELTNLDNFNQNLDLYLSISYKGDVARIYADGQLIEDNFWNGKPMLVRLRDLIGKKVELRILPLGKDYPIYFQKEQRAELDKSQGFLLSLDSIKMVERKDIE